MTCIKTGAHVYLEQYNEWAYGDMHEFEHVDREGCSCISVYILRVAQREFQPIIPVKHFTFLTIEGDWQDKPYGTILSLAAINHGYEGVPV